MKKPSVAKDSYVAESSDILGDVTIGNGSSIWHHATLRGDVAPIIIGEETNIQDNCVVHVSTDVACRVGDRTTVGHSVILHSCTVGDECLIGMGSIILDGAVIEDHVLIGAGSIVTKNKVIPAGSLVMGSPAKVVRSLTEEEIEDIRCSATEYKNIAEAFKKGDIQAYHGEG